MARMWISSDATDVVVIAVLGQHWQRGTICICLESRLL